jgi:murein L,D-transpeptidase YafK
MMIVVPTALAFVLTMQTPVPQPPARPAEDPKLATGAKADRIVVHKKDRTMHLMNRGQILKTYKIALGGTPEGPKQQQGDHKSPEGVYTIDSRNSKSAFYLALHISYPSAQDRARARRMGVDPGGAIMIHGLGKAFGYVGSLHTATDWTDGCIAVTNEEIEEIWRLVPLGIPIEIFP